MAKPLIIYIDIHNLHSNAERILLGVIDYIRGYTDWQIVHEERLADASFLPSAIPTRGVTVKVQSIGKQFTVRSNPFLIAKMAIDHAADRGFRQLAIYAADREIGDAFVACTGNNCSVEVIDNEPPADALSRRCAWIGIDVCAAHIAKMLVYAGLEVPGDAIVLGIGNAQLYCESAVMPLSSIDLNQKMIGFSAAQQLHRVVKIRRTVEDVLLPPIEIVQRASTDALAIDDEDLAAAVRFIRTNAHRPIEIADVLRDIPLHRRALERRFRKILGRSPAEELRHCRVKIAQHLLSRTDQPMTEIASRAGFLLPAHLAAAFKQVTGLTPTSYREQFKRK